MATLIFVHGTGVRGDAYARLIATVRGELRAERPSLTTLDCFWGDQLGIKLNAGGASIPSYTTARALATAASPNEEALALWALLYRDPVLELRLLATPSAGDDAADELAPRTTAAWRPFDRAVRQLAPSAPTADLLAATGLEPFWDDAWREVVESSTYESAIQTVGQSAANHRRAIARAAVASAIVDAGDAGVAAPDGRQRDALVDLLIADLGGSERGIGTFLTDRMKGAAARLVTSYARRNRGAVTDATSPAAGDILLYQAHGGEIRDLIAARVGNLPPPVCLLAHSLGGIACVDLLVSRSLPSVTQLVTVGSQAPFLYEIDALTSLRYGSALPERFPAWTNIYDPRDILSYIVAGIRQFTDRPKGTFDVAVDNGQPFPQAHSAYWTNPQVWRAVLSLIP